MSTPASASLLTSTALTRLGNLFTWSTTGESRSFDRRSLKHDGVWVTSVRTVCRELDAVMKGLALKAMNLRVRCAGIRGGIELLNVVENGRGHR